MYRQESDDRTFCSPSAAKMLAGGQWNFWNGNCATSNHGACPAGIDVIGPRSSEEATMSIIYYKQQSHVACCETDPPAPTSNKGYDLIH
jgi:hypothetical protein